MSDRLMAAQFDQLAAVPAARTRWQPGMPVVTAQDHAEWTAWRHDRALTLQKDRRKRMRRIDYYADEAAAAIVDKLRAPGIGGDASSILNRIVAEWAAATSLQ